MLFNKYNNSYFRRQLNYLKFWLIKTLYWLFVDDKIQVEIENIKNADKEQLRRLSSKKYNAFVKQYSKCYWCNRIFNYKKKQSNYCCKKCKKLMDQEKRQIFKHNNVCDIHHHEKLTYKNMCWSCYKEEFEDMLLNEGYLNNKKGKIPLHWRIRLYLNGFELIPTYRTSKNSWNGDKPAFEQSLVDLNVKYFIYLKFYINNKGKIKPILVGKSASSVINYTGSDLNFSTDITHGPSRQFIKLNKFSWYYDFIAIKKASSNEKAYKLESKYQDKWDLYGS